MIWATQSTLNDDIEQKKVSPFTLLIA